MTTRVLFVCLGNICRSPTAHGLLERRAADAGLDVEVDSAGTGDWHLGEPPHRGAQAVAVKNGLDIAGLRARKVRAEDFFDYDYIVAMDGQNLADLKALRPTGSRAKLTALMHYAARPDEDVLDPYGMGPDAFDGMYAQIEAGVDGLVRDLRQAH